MAKNLETIHDQKEKLIWALIDGYLKEHELLLDVAPRPQLGCIPGDEDCEASNCKHGMPLVIKIRPSSPDAWKRPYLNALGERKSRKTGGSYGSAYRWWLPKDTVPPTSVAELYGMALMQLAIIKSWPTKANDVFYASGRKATPELCFERASQSRQLAETLTYPAYRDLDKVAEKLSKLV